MITNNRTISDDMFENASLHVPNGRWQSVFGLAVIPSKRHQGCASTLMRAFIEKARQEGRDGLILTCKEKLIPFMRALATSTAAFPSLCTAERCGMTWSSISVKSRVITE